ncbi:MAG: UDP-N-acetylmuramate--L-alanine ligase [Nitrospirae bacterium CG_4_9_14_3_um_filter_53_35]|nr:MAG: UDP-N-acetylmuramate--L-alanine ligase [Nitrospirae bacterium CG2_30_53_67]PIS37080.1 MAG: UDP-N-acetylmuramate--L-alanine ligase [Nitrospirae bacterium CG08_land_8_20_14_0_20_52_24]PIW84264.1 MAG: UDP-N-acetylmuramate--L-alanine ligase [Nitrospirae bacterium CG_4_8_14_3_um_filter_50_41]PIX86851.1 MAG: UDP-N-acetylmuramate--L-alanine ligase [Nitrospirae bacterium CG_4_10_14_3_um_filter_53_41]PJA76582.1 MAG: UDP-N-acetylmuramate--L-alanine ligase [Nitrospirae bacterium CG_4_9_14_3_um_fil
MYKKVQKIHFVGIGGSGMNGIAEVLINMGHQVSGSDLKSSPVTDRLKKMGARITIGHAEENVADVDVVVISSAVSRENPEVRSAEAQLIPVIPRAEMLAELMRMKYGIAVAGAHGKTTTTSMIATVLGHGGIDPTVVIGGRLNSIGSNARLGQSDFLVAEADESDGSFLKLSPTIAVVTNIDEEHLDFYGDLEKIKKTFLEFVNRVPFYGLAVLCLDNPHVQGLIPGVKKRFLSYGTSAQADLQAEEFRQEVFGSEFKVNHKGKSLGHFRLHAHGVHNILNALAAIAVGLELGLSPQVIREGLDEYSGVHRRFTLLGEAGGVMVVDDYGHHPTEIEATLAAAKEVQAGRIVTVFQPHRYTRTRALLHRFVTCFNQSDIVVLTDIYPAGEAPILGVSAENIYRGMKEHGHRDVTYIQDMKKIVDHLEGILKPGDLVLTMGAGDIYKVGEELLRRLKKK